MGRLMMRLRAIGADGLFTLLLSNIFLVATVGLSLGWPLLYVIRVGRNASIMAQPDSVLVVLGMRLSNREIDGDYKMRLNRATKLYVDDDNRYILIVGGITGTSLVSEAIRGKEYLISCGVRSEQIFIEDASRHTLENLRNARSFMASKGFDKFTLITNRYHLARSLMIAQGLSLNPDLCAAENDFKMEITRLPRLLLEAYYIHWYLTGSIWSRLIRNKKSLKRIS